MNPLRRRPDHSAPPDGNAADIFEKGPGPMKPYSDDLLNFKQQRDTAFWLMKACIVIIGICVIVTVLIATTYNYKTYVVRVDNATGQVETGGELKATNYSPREAEIKYFLTNFVADTRTVPLDPVQYKNNVDRASHYLTTQSANKLADMLKNDDPRAKLGKMTVQPTIRSIQLQPGSKGTYQVRWSEEEYSLSGSSTHRINNYVALFAVTVDPPTKEAELLINPLGLKIKDLTMSIESTSKAPTPAMQGGTSNET